LVVFFGVSLTRSVVREVEQKERLQKLSDELKIANVRLQELDQQKTDFLSIASHQLRTPLTVFKGFLELLEDGGYGKPTKDMMKVFKDLDINNEHLVKLVDEFLNVSRIEQGRTKWDFKENNINQIVAEAVQQLNDKANNKKMEIVWSDNNQPLSAIMDQEKIFHVVYNYIDNAIKYSDRGQVIIKVSEENDGIALRVKDSGIGFGAVDGDSFFQKFYRGTNVSGINVGGTGLGLYVCLKFIEAHRGKVWGDSPGLGKGSEFGFWIPYGHTQS